MAVINFPLDQAFLIAIWLEAILYGILIPTVVSSIYVLLAKKKVMEKINMPMLVAAILMFTLATAHIGINGWRMLKGYVFDRLATGGPVAFLYSLNEPTQKAKDAIYATQCLIGDVLNIYRAWLVWNKNIWIVALPILLWIPTCVVAYWVPLHLFFVANPYDDVFMSTYKAYITTWYTLSLVQNLIATGLIAFCLWHHERQIGSSRSGNFSLLPIMAIIIESASLYVAAQLVLLITYCIDDNAQYVLLECITPIVGIVFCLIITRTAIHAFNLRVNATIPTSIPSSGCSAGTNP